MQRRVFKPNPARIDFAMAEQKVSAEAIGRAAGHADGSYIRRMRKGEKRAQTAELRTADATARMLGLPRDYLFTEIDPRTGRPLSTAPDSKTVVTEKVPA